MGIHTTQTVSYCHPERERVGYGLCGPCYALLYLEDHREETYARNRARAYRLRIRILTHYSTKGYLSCSCQKCDIVEPEFLTLDHLEGGGKRHRKSLGNSGSFYYWIINNNFPPEFQTLCMNCNHGRGKKGSNGICPHFKLP